MSVSSTWPQTHRAITKLVSSVMITLSTRDRVWQTRVQGKHQLNEWPHCKLPEGRDKCFHFCFSQFLDKDETLVNFHCMVVCSHICQPKDGFWCHQDRKFTHCALRHTKLSLTVASAPAISHHLPQHLIWPPTQSLLGIRSVATHSRARVLWARSCWISGTPSLFLPLS